MWELGFWIWDLKAAGDEGRAFEARMDREDGRKGERRAEGRARAEDRKAKDRNGRSLAFE
jgi:hypothetical protein